MCFGLCFKTFVSSIIAYKFYIICSFNQHQKLKFISNLFSQFSNLFLGLEIEGALVGNSLCFLSSYVLLVGREVYEVSFRVFGVGFKAGKK